MKPVDLRESWNRLSAHYQRHHPLTTQAAHYGPLAPDESVLRLLGDVHGKRILELGCGGGQCSIAFAKQGAACVGVDLSDAQIDYARALAETEQVSVQFIQSDMLAFLEEQPAAAYDVVFSAYAFQYVENLAAVFRQARRVLRPGGLFVFSLDHPLNDVVSMEHGKPVLSRSYFARGRMDWNWDYPADGFIVPFYSFHRTVGDFLSMLVEAGFIVERLLEPEPVDETDAWIPPEEFERYAMVPATIIWKARVPERAVR